MPFAYSRNLSGAPTWADPGLLYGKDFVLLLECSVMLRISSGSVSSSSSSSSSSGSASSCRQIFLFPLLVVSLLRHTKWPILGSYCIKQFSPFGPENLHGCDTWFLVGARSLAEKSLIIRETSFCQHLSEWSTFCAHWNVYHKYSVLDFERNHGLKREVQNNSKAGTSLPSNFLALGCFPSIFRLCKIFFRKLFQCL